MQTFALLGAHPELSLAEIQAVTGSMPVEAAGQRPAATAESAATATTRTTHVALFDDANWNFSELQNRLGGTQKLGVVIGTVKKLDMKELAAFLAADLIEQVPEGKIHFGLSIYGNDPAKVNSAKDILKNLGYELKNVLKEAGRSARYVISREATLSSVVLKHNDLLTKGAEFCFLIRDNDIVIGKTLAAQDVDVWSHRDMDRPRRNAKQGMLPPKLARMMVNLASGALLPLLSKEGARGVVLDPFCGSGTVLMEAGMLGATELIGGDIAPMATADTKANIEWLRGENPTVPEAALYTMRASDLGNAIPEHSVDAIITETYLGRPRKGNESVEDIQKALDYISMVYEETFRALKPTLKPGGMVVLTSPLHIVDDKEMQIDAVHILEGLGYTYLPTSFEPLVYRHENQLVGRRILRFTVK